MQNLALESYHWRFDSGELIDPDLVEELTLSVCDNCSLSYPNSKLHLLLSEMFANALDHGILGLRSELKDEPDGFQKFYLERQKRLSSLDYGSVSVIVENLYDGFIRITLQDSGSGFDYKNYQLVSDERTSLHGRGLDIINKLCSSVNHYGNGNCIVVEFDTADIRNADSKSGRKRSVLSD